MINNKLLETLYNLDNTFGVSGNEEETAAALRKEMEGLYDEHIEDPLGSHDDRTAVNQDMVVMTESGKKVYGVTGSKPAHIMTEEDHEKVIKIEDLYVDFGTTSREETQALGVEAGDYMGFAREGYVLNNGKFYTGKSVDQRADSDSEKA